MNYKIFAFPFTDYKITNAFFDKIEQNQIYDLSFGTSGLKTDLIKFNLQRIPMEINNLSANEIIKTEYFYYFLKSFINKNIIKRT